MPTEINHDSDLLEVVEHQEKKAIAEPPKYKVWLLNDNATPMQFVVDVLQEVFQKPREIAIQIMLQVHTQERGLIAIYPKEIAQMKRDKVVKLAREAGHPLQVAIEPDVPAPA